MHAITHLIYAYVRTATVSNHALYVERGLQTADRGPNGGALGEDGAGGVLPAGQAETRRAGCSAVV